jgi:IS5 family transposase
MLPQKSPCDDPESALFQTPLLDLIDPRHALVTLAQKLDWAKMELLVADKFCADGAAAIPSRLMFGLHYLKHAFNCSDEVVVARWQKNPDWQYFCGEKCLRHQAPIDPSSMTRWRQRLGADTFEQLLQETIRVGLATQTIREKSLATVNVDSTVQKKAILYPTDGKLYHAMREKLVRLARQHAVSLRQSYVRTSKNALRHASRYFRARQKKRGQREVRAIKKFLGRVTRDIERQVENDTVKKELFAEALELARRLLTPEKNDKNKIYRIHEPDVEGITKGKERKKYEPEPTPGFGNKVSLVATSAEGFVVGAQGLSGNPYDGHTLPEALAQAERLCGAGKIKSAFTDLGYRGHEYHGSITVQICDQPQSKKKLPRAPRNLLKQRAAIEAMIGHQKNAGRLGRNYLQGQEGDKVNALLCSAGWNLRLILRHLAYVGRTILA